MWIATLPATLPRIRPFPVTVPRATSNSPRHSYPQPKAFFQEQCNSGWGPAVQTLPTPTPNRLWFPWMARSRCKRHSILYIWTTTASHQHHCSSANPFGVEECSYAAALGLFVAVKLRARKRRSVQAIQFPPQTATDNQLTV
jgi:hypothetical protein